MELSVWHEVYRELCKKVPTFRYPDWFDYLAEQIPAEDSRARRDVTRFLSLLEAVARCRSFSDGRQKKSNEIEIDFGDYCVAYRILSEAFASTYAGVHPAALEFARAVRELWNESKRPVTTKEVAEKLRWKEPVAHKWRVEAVKRRLVQYEPGTFQRNAKLLLPGAERATKFLPHPRVVLKDRPDIGNEVRFIDPLSGTETVLRRRGTKVEHIKK